MIYLDEKKLQKVAFHLVTFKNPKLGNNLIKNNINSDRLFRLSHSELSLLGFLCDEIVEIKTNYKKIAEEELKKTEKNDIDILFKGEELYPPLLTEIYDPPEFIYVMGDKNILKTEKIAVVGSRKGSDYGLSSLNCILPDLARSGITIVSGMAYGVYSIL